MWHKCGHGNDDLPRDEESIRMHVKSQHNGNLTKNKAAGKVVDTPKNGQDNANLTKDKADGKVIDTPPKTKRKRTKRQQTKYKWWSGWEYKCKFCSEDKKYYHLTNMRKHLEEKCNKKPDSSVKIGKLAQNCTVKKKWHQCRICEKYIRHEYVYLAGHIKTHDGKYEELPIIPVP